MDLEENEEKEKQWDPSSLVYIWYSLAVHTSLPGKNNVKLDNTDR